MIKEASPSPRAGALSQLVIASVGCCHCGRHYGMGAGAVRKAWKQRPQEAGDGLAAGRVPTSGRRVYAQAETSKLINTDISASEKLEE